MRDQGDVPYIVIERESGGGLGSFVLGALVGAGLALLFAPQSGRETQEEIKDQARKLRSAAEERVRDAHRHLEERFEVAKEGVHARVDSVKEAVEAALAHEVYLTKEIHKLHRQADEEGDLATVSMLDWFVAEQVEEEHLVSRLVKRIGLAGNSDIGLVVIDGELGGGAGGGAEKAPAE